jgi:malonyl-CoA decarboxylase
MAEGDHAAPVPKPVPRAGGAAPRGGLKGDPAKRPFLQRFLGSLGRPMDDAQRARDVISMCHGLLSERGEVSGVRRATEILTAYRSLTHPARERFFDLLVAEFSPDPAEVARAAEAYAAEPSQANLTMLQGAVEPPRQELFRRLNLAPTATAVLVEMRRQLLATIEARPERIGIDADLAHLFRAWFNAGFLRLQRIDWRTSALVLERLIQYEAVHQIQGWRDLRRRLEADRRCYAFFHPAMPDEPLIFIEAALTRGLSGKVQPLLDPDSPVLDAANADCAIFYSITNCQEGLRGVSFGNFLIKSVVEDLQRNLSQLRTFATLSPIPGFVGWLKTAGSAAASPSPELAALLESIDSTEDSSWPSIATGLRSELQRLCAYYLLHAKLGRLPLDPVARFHLANGARLERLNWLGDTSAKGMRRSVGLMANYVYRLADVERHHEAYATDYKVIASHELERLARDASQPARRRRRSKA